MAVLQVINEPAKGTRTVLVWDGFPEDGGPLIRGADAEETLDCGNCGAVLVALPPHQQISNVVIRCPCGAHNEIPPA
jgi:hypothetical protein